MTDGTIERITSSNSGVKSNPTDLAGPKSLIGTSRLEVLLDMISNSLIAISKSKIEANRKRGTYINNYLSSHLQMES